MVSQESEKVMDSQQQILKHLKNSLPKNKVAHPEVPTFAKPGVDLLAQFKDHLEIAAGSCYEVTSIAEAQQIMAQKLPEASLIVSATQEWPGTVNLTSQTRPHDLEPVDIGVMRAEFGVAEMGSVWLTENSMVVNSIGFLPQHLVILLDPEAISENMNTAYKRVSLVAQHYGCFMMGPSATADIGATMVHGAQGARSLTVFLLPSP